MFEFAAVTYGLLASVILSAAQRNHRMERPHPPMLLYTGYMLCGLSAGVAVILAYIALVAICRRLTGEVARLRFCCGILSCRVKESGE